MVGISRRSAIAAGVVGGVIGLGACVNSLTWVGPGSSTDDGELELEPGELPAYSQWLPATLFAGTDRASVSYADFDRIRAEWTDDGRETAAQKYEYVELSFMFGVDESALSGEVSIEVATGDDIHDPSVFLGSYDPPSVAESLGAGDDVESYNGYDVTPNNWVIHPDAVFWSNDHESMIDAKAGTEDRIYQVDDQWDEILRYVSEAPVSGVWAGPDTAFERAGYTIDHGDDGYTATGYFLFDDAETAEAHRDSVADVLLADTDGSVERIGRGDAVILVEAAVEPKAILTLSFE